MFGESCLFAMGTLYVHQLLSMAQRKVNACIHDINSLLLTIRMGSKHSSVRHLFKTPNVHVLETLVRWWLGAMHASSPKPIDCIVYWPHTITWYASWKEEGSGSKRRVGKGRSLPSYFQWSRFPNFPIFLILVCLGGAGGIPACLCLTPMNNPLFIYPKNLSADLRKEGSDLIHAFVQFTVVLNLLFKYGTSWT